VGGRCGGAGGFRGARRAGAAESADALGDSIILRRSALPPVNAAPVGVGGACGGNIAHRCHAAALAHLYASTGYGMRVSETAVQRLPPGIPSERRTGRKNGWFSSMHRTSSDKSAAGGTVAWHPALSAWLAYVAFCGRCAGSANCACRWRGGGQRRNVAGLPLYYWRAISSAPPAGRATFFGENTTNSKVCGRTCCRVLPPFTHSACSTDLYLGAAAPAMLRRRLSFFLCLLYRRQHPEPPSTAKGNSKAVLVHRVARGR